jgi:chaperone required for assembly of F1-ATPase
MKRFYRQVSVASDERGHRVLLDERPLHTPAKCVLIAPSAELAEAIASEWRSQGETIEPQSLPLTRLASTAVDRMPQERAAAIEELLGYAGTDLLCYRASGPLDLVRRQQHAWQPLLDWAGETYGVRLAVTNSILPLAQAEAALGNLPTAIEALDDWPLIGLHAATTALGSLVLGLALACRRIDAAEALGASLLDEDFEIERWGREAEAERRQAALRRDVEAAATFLARLPAAHQLNRGPSG